MITFTFSKYSGCGNDFVLVDNRGSFFPIENRAAIQLICNRREGVGADGLILLTHSHKANFRMRIFNCDGSEAEMCGNGIRCLMKFIHKLHPEITHCQVETAERVLSLEIVAGQIKATVGDPTDLQWNLKIAHPQHQTLHFMNTGVPHCVVFVSNIDAVDLMDIGPHLRHHPLFGPKGTNVNIALTTNGQVHYRTFERGVEGETPACGTGAVAVALATAYTQNWPSPITVQTRSGQHLEIGFTHQDDHFSNVTMTGPATHIFDGTWGAGVRG